MAEWYTIRTYKVITKNGLSGRAIAVSPEGSETEGQSRERMTIYKKRYNPDVLSLQLIEESHQFRR